MLDCRVEGNVTRKEFTMKIRSLLVGTMTLLAGLGAARAGTSVSVGIQINSARDFYEPLGSQGTWVQTSRYGRCWYPAYVDHGWRPYCYGHWEWSDEGWYWNTDEPWGWATYHYGRWVWDSYYGWVWVPDTVWGPSWVSWREGGGYVGWAPLPPNYGYEPGTEIVAVEPRFFIFVEHRHFCEQIRPNILVVNQTVINKTVNITKIGKGSTVVVNQGPSLNVIEKNNPGKVLKVKVERPMPREVQQFRPENREVSRSQPEVIRGTRRNADATSVVSPVPPAVDEDRGQSKVERRPEKRPLPPPAPVVVQPKPQPLSPTAAQPEQSDYERGKRHRNRDDDTGTLDSKGK
jgi:hypothetical protein